MRKGRGEGAQGEGGGRVADPWRCPLRNLSIAAWVLLALEAAFVLLLFLQRNVGDDAAGRGMARGFSFVLAPVVALAAGLLWWAQRGGPAGAFWAGLGIVALPVALVLLNAGGGLLRTINHSLGRAQHGRFDDAALTRLARAIEQNDLVAVRAALAKGAPDFAARDRAGSTILGCAVQHALDDYGGDQRVEPVRLLLAAGAKPAADALAPAATQASVDLHLIIPYVYGGNSPGAVALLDALLAAGGDANAVNWEGEPLVFSSYGTLAKLQVLARHGANLRVLDARSDRKGWTAVMVKAQLGEWDQAEFLAEQGVPLGHLGADGTTLAKVLEEKEAQARAYGAQVPEGLVRLRERVGR